MGFNIWRHGGLGAIRSRHVRDITAFSSSFCGVGWCSVCVDFDLIDEHLGPEPKNTDLSRPSAMVLFFFFGRPDPALLTVGPALFALRANWSLRFHSPVPAQWYSRPCLRQVLIKMLHGQCLTQSLPPLKVRTQRSGPL